MAIVTVVVADSIITALAAVAVLTVELVGNSDLHDSICSNINSWRRCRKWWS